MEKIVNFRDYQEEQANDFNNLQAFAQQSFDDLVNDAVTASIRYSGFDTAITGTAEVTVSPGRFYGPNANNQIGAIFPLSTATIVNLMPYLAVTSQRYVTLVTYGVTDQTDSETRDFLTNITTGQTEPQVVSMQTARQAVIGVVAGTEAAAPVPPAIPTNQVPICNILLSPTAVVSVTMLKGFLIHSTEDLDNRLALVEEFDQQVETQVSTLTSDLAALANQYAGQGNLRPLVIELLQDMAYAKALLQLPSSYSEYGASYLTWADATQFDVNNTQALGFSANIDQGIRFPWQNQAAMSLAMFNPLDPNGVLNQGTGLLLPAYTEIVKLQTGNLPVPVGPQNTPAAVSDQVALGQYGYQTFQTVEIDVPYTRIQNGPNFSMCTNGATTLGSASSQYVDSGGVYDNNGPSWLPNFQEYSVVSGVDFFANNASNEAPGQDHEFTNYDYLMIQSWTQPYWATQAVNRTVSGALIAQTILIGSDMWLSQVALWFSSVASATDVNIAVCLTTNGMPDLTQIIATSTLSGASLTQGMNRAAIPPTYVQSGMRIAVVIYSMANHQVGLVPAGSYHGGTFFYSLDGAYFLGDLTKDLAVQLWGCEFSSSQVTIQLNSLNLQGGIRDIDITAKMQIPSACQLIFEVQPVGTSAWIPISVDAPLAPFQAAPVLANLRARFVGSPDIMPGLFLTDSLVLIEAPGPTFKFVSLPETLAAPSQNITVKVRVEDFDPTPHSCNVYLYTGSPLARVSPTTQKTSLVAATPKAVDANTGDYEITATFALGANVSSFVIDIEGSTNSIANTYLVANMVWYAL